jgi:hypothetical protein
MSHLIKIVSGITIFLLVMFGMFWLFKIGSYWLLYEDMVKETIKEIVKPEYLILLK